MTAEADSAAKVLSQAECEADGERTGTSGHLPVFDAFDELGLSGRDIAELVEVTPPTVSKWRAAKIRVPGEKLAFMTLALAHLLDEAETVAAMNDELGDDLQHTRAHKRGPDMGHIEAARAGLVYQDVLNRDLPPQEVRGGAQRFRTWWASGAAKKLQDKHFKPLVSADVLEVLKKMRNKR